MDILVVGGLGVATIALAALAAAVYSTNKAIERDLDQLRQRAEALEARADGMEASDRIPTPPGAEVRVVPGGGGGGGDGPTEAQPVPCPTCGKPMYWTGGIVGKETRGFLLCSACGGAQQRQTDSSAAARAVTNAVGVPVHQLVVDLDGTVRPGPTQPSGSEMDTETVLEELARAAGRPAKQPRVVPGPIYARTGGPNQPLGDVSWR